MYERLLASLRSQKATIGAAKLITAISASIHYVISRPWSSRTNKSREVAADVSD